MIDWKRLFGLTTIISLLGGVIYIFQPVCDRVNDYDRDFSGSNWSMAKKKSMEIEFHRKYAGESFRCVSLAERFFEIVEK